MRKWLLLALFLLLPWLIPGLTPIPEVPGTVLRHLACQGIDRTYRLHAPPGSEPLPLVVVLHGGGSSDRQIERLTRFSELADKEHFIVAYPQGLEGNWNDGRADEIDDVAFIRAVVKDIPHVDENRIFATGLSNGGLMCSRLALQAEHPFAAIAPIAGGIATGLTPCKAGPLSVLIMQGDKDPLVPYQGGKVARGSILSAEDCMRSWVELDQCQKPGTITRPAPAVARTLYSGGSAGSEVCFYRIEGGGHVWPGAPGETAPFLGRACPDLDATQIIWNFFQRHPRL